MKLKTLVTLAVINVVLPRGACAGEANAEVDAATGLVIASGWEQVRAHCGGCHSYQLVTSQRGGATFWRDTIRWMQRTQNLWALEPAVEEAIVGYLAAEYTETDWGRRPNLSVTLMPDPAAAPGSR